MIGSKIIRLNETASTNSYASELVLAEKTMDGTVIYTQSQTAGKGQQGNSWESQPGKNLTISVILHPSFIAPQKQFRINKFVSLAVLDFLSLHISDSMSLKIKWPNDIYINNRKIGGILIENTIMSNKIKTTIAGIGININQEEFSSKHPNAVSLKSAIGKQLNVEDCLSELLIKLNERYFQLTSEQENSLDSDYLKNLFRFDVYSNYKVGDYIIRGKIVGITDIGRLRLCDEKGDFSDYAFKEIEFIN